MSHIYYIGTWLRRMVDILNMLLILQELKGNIRVFCRVRPLLPERESNTTEGAIVSYPTSTEFLGRGIDLMHHGRSGACLIAYSIRIVTHLCQKSVFCHYKQLRRIHSHLIKYSIMKLHKMMCLLKSHNWCRVHLMDIRWFTLCFVMNCFAYYS